MLQATLTKDILLAILWCILRATPFVLLYEFIIHIRVDAPLIGAVILCALIFVLSFGIVAWVTVAVPALFWRYRKKHLTRTVMLDGHGYNQVKIFGLWFFIRFTNDTSYMMSSNTWFNVEGVRVWSHRSTEFAGQFERFINEWRFDRCAEVLKYHEFEEGRLK